MIDYTTPVIRGDERLANGSVTPGKFCLNHGYMRLCQVLARGECYTACGFCLEHSANVKVLNAESVHDP